MGERPELTLKGLAASSIGSSKRVRHSTRQAPFKVHRNLRLRVATTSSSGSQKKHEVGVETYKADLSVV